MVKFFCKNTHFTCKWILPYGTTLLCALDTTFPFNMAWLLNIVLENFFGVFASKLSMLIAILLNNCIWKMIFTRGYDAATQMLVGAASVTYCQEVVKLQLTACIENTKWSSSLNSLVFLHKMTLCRITHLLVELFNDGISTIFFVIFFGSGVVQILSVVTIIDHTTLSPLLILVFAVLAAQTVLNILVVYGVAGDVFEVSLNSISCLRRKVKIVNNLSRVQRRYLERFLASCAVERVDFGMSNFIEKTTPLEFQLFCLERIIDLLLLR